MQNLKNLLFSSFFIFITIFITIFNNGCEDKSNNKGLHKIHWDRDMCELCKMVISERHYAVQILNPENNRSYMFDDLGCAILWFKDEKIEWEKDAIIYISDSIDGKFIDAKTAFYDSGSRTPMDYGFGAYKDSKNIKNQDKILNFDEVKLKILRGETSQNIIK